MGEPSMSGTICYGFRLTHTYTRRNYYTGDPETVTEDLENVPWLRNTTQDTQQTNDEENSTEYLAFDEWREYLFNKQTPRPYERFDRQRDDTDPAYKKAWSDYWKSKHAFEDELGIEMVEHSHLDSECRYILAIKESIKHASYRSPTALGTEMVVKPGWREKIENFCKEHNIPFQEPQFFLCCDAG